MLKINLLSKLLTNLYHTFISSQAWVAFCFALLCKYVQVINAWHYDVLIYIAFFATLLAYNFAHWVSDKAKWRVLVMFISGLFCVVYGFWYLDFRVILVLGVLGAISIFYSYTIFDKTLRSLPNIKILAIGLVWSVTAVLPAIIDRQHWSPQIAFLALSLFFYVIAITIPFDIRDLDEDDASMKTLPQRFGVKGSILIGIISVILSALFYTYYISFDWAILHYEYLISLTFALVFLLWTRMVKNIWFTAFWLEGLSALPLLLHEFLA